VSSTLPVVAGHAYGRGVIDIPDEFACQTALREGQPGHIWLDTLPDLVDSRRKLT
jgi:hypothetical protein